MSETTWVAIDDGWVIDRNGERICQCADNDEADRLVAATNSLRSELAALRESARWIPIEDDVPADCKDVLVWNGEPRQGWLDTDSGRFKDSAGGQLHGVTHWRPMPAPPEPQAVTEVPNG